MARERSGVDSAPIIFCIGNNVRILDCLCCGQAITLYESQMFGGGRTGITVWSASPTSNMFHTPLGLREGRTGREGEGGREGEKEGRDILQLLSL